MPTITFDVPDGALSALRLSPTEFVKEMRVAAALLWYSHGELSQSKAAEIAGTSRAEFIDELAHRRIPVVQVTAEELQDAMRVPSDATIDDTKLTDYLLTQSTRSRMARMNMARFIESRAYSMARR